MCVCVWYGVNARGGEHSGGTWGVAVRLYAGDQEAFPAEVGVEQRSGGRSERRVTGSVRKNVRAAGQLEQRA